MFPEAIVFVVGGGSYVEFTNLGEYAIRATKADLAQTGGASAKRITYGSTEIVPPGDFLKSLGALAKS